MTTDKEIMAEIAKLEKQIDNATSAEELVALSEKMIILYNMLKPIF